MATDDGVLATIDVAAQADRRRSARYEVTGTLTLIRWAGTNRELPLTLVLRDVSRHGLCGSFCDNQAPDIGERFTVGPTPASARRARVVWHEGPFGDQFLVGLELDLPGYHPVAN